MFFNLLYNSEQYNLMSITKELIKKHKQIEVQIKSLTKKRLNDRTRESWKDLKELKKRKLQLKDKITRLS